MHLTSDGNIRHQHQSTDTLDSNDDSDSDTSAMREDVSSVINLANCIIGVSILAMPFCFQQSGIILSTLLLFASSVLTKVTCHLLLRAAHITRRHSYEYLALTSFGAVGKIFVELSMIVFLMATLCAFLVMIGDIGPHIVADYLQLVAPTQRVRLIVMFLSCICFILPLSLLRNLDSLSIISSASVIFYMIFVVRMLIECAPRLVEIDWTTRVNWWRPDGLLTTLPIITMALSCQTQLFCVADCIPDLAAVRMDSVVSNAVNFCSVLYASVGFFGYVAFSDQQLHGDILVYLESTFWTQLLKLGFMLSVAVSFPLMLFPCRTAVYQMFCRPQISELRASVTIPDGTFRLLTVLLISINLVLAILIPNVEYVLGLTGAMIGNIVCTIMPAAMFLAVATKHNRYVHMCAKAALVVGIFMLVASTVATLRSNHESDYVDQPMPKHRRSPTASDEEYAAAKVYPNDANVPSAIVDINRSIDAAYVDKRSNERIEPAIPDRPEPVGYEQNPVDDMVPEKVNDEHQQVQIDDGGGNRSERIDNDHV